MRKIFLLSLLITVFFSVNAFAFTEYETALKLYSRGEFKEAAGLLEQYTEKAPEPSAYYLLGYAQYNIGKYKEANESFNNAFLIDPEFSPRILLKKIEEIKGKEGIKPAIKVRKEPKSPAEEKKGPAKPAGKTEVKPVQAAPKPAAPPAAAPELPKPTEQAEPVQKSVPETGKAPEEKQPEPPAEPVDENIVKPAVIKPKAEMPQPGFLENPIVLIGVLFSIVFYIYFAVCLFFIARKLDVPAPWMAFVPLAQQWTVAKSADMPGWWAVLLVVPVVNIFVLAYLFMRIADNLGKSLWLGFLMLVPVVNLIWLGFLAFKGEKKEEAADEEFAGTEDAGAVSAFGMEGLEEAAPETSADDFGMAEPAPAESPFDEALVGARAAQPDIEETDVTIKEEIPEVETPSISEGPTEEISPEAPSQGQEEWSPESEGTLQMAEPEEPRLEDTTSIASQTIPYIETESKPSFIKKLAYKFFGKRKVAAPAAAEPPASTELYEGLDLPELSAEVQHDTATAEPSTGMDAEPGSAFQESQTPEPETFSFGDSPAGEDMESYDLPDIDLVEPSEGLSFAESPVEADVASAVEAPVGRETQEFSGTTKMEATPDFETMELPSASSTPENFETMELGPTPSEESSGEAEFMDQYKETGETAAESGDLPSEDAGAFDSTEQIQEGGAGAETVPSGKKSHIKPLLGALAFAAAFAAGYFFFLR